MATTPNNGWTIPADTDLVRDGAAAMRTLGNGIDTTLGKWTSYTPTVGGTGWSLGNGTVQGQYQRIGDTVHFMAQFILGSTSGKSANAVTLSLPLNNSGFQDQWVTGIVYDSSASARYRVSVQLTSNACVFWYGSTTMSQVNSTTPFAWATSDVIQINGTYKVA